MIGAEKPTSAHRCLGLGGGRKRSGTCFDSYFSRGQQLLVVHGFPQAALQKARQERLGSLLDPLDPLRPMANERPTEV